jgi:hypothetical protein
MTDDTVIVHVHVYVYDYIVPLAVGCMSNTSTYNLHIDIFPHMPFFGGAVQVSAGVCVSKNMSGMCMCVFVSVHACACMKYS